MKQRKKNTNSNNSIKLPIWIVLIGLLSFFVVGFRLCVLALNVEIDGINIQTFAGKRNSTTKLLPAKRGTIYDVNGNYNPNEDEILGKLSGIEENTDEMELSKDDLDYLRRLADMEWKKEFTTASIKVDMTNNNNVQSERDLDGIVAYLADTLREEMTIVADGVHY